MEVAVCVGAEVSHLQGQGERKWRGVPEKVSYKGYDELKGEKRVGEAQAGVVCCQGLGVRWYRGSRQ